MDKSLIIGIIGTLVSIVFGFLSIDLFKRKKYPGKITYVKLSLIDLLNSVANNFNDIELLHKKLPINKNIIYLKGALLNSGDIDINSKLTEKDITMELPEGCKWLDVKTTDCSDGLNSIIDIESDRKASFKFDLFRKDEFVQFEGLIEAESNDISSNIINKDLVFSHRIENTSKVERKTLISEKELKNKKKSALIYSIALLFLLAFLTATSVFNLFGANKETVYFRKKDNSSNVFYSVQLANNSVYLDAKNGDGELTLSIDEFNEKYIASIDKLTFWQKFKDFYWVFTIQLSLFLVIVLWELLEIRSAKKLSSILKK